ncbi:MAG: dihydrofolate reductase [Myxococcota bacterium]
MSASEEPWRSEVSGPVMGIIAAVSPEGVIGLDGDIPWYYPADLKRFKRLTTGTAIVMGRLTWESLPRKPLPNRRNIVVSRREDLGVETVSSVKQAIDAAGDAEIWFIGGARLYEEAMAVANVIDLTYVPDKIANPKAVLFPDIDPERFIGLDRTAHPDDPRLEHQTFISRTLRD